MARSAVQLTMRDKGATGKDLYHEIEDLATNGTLPPLMREWSHEVRELGNDSAHPRAGIPPTTQEDARDIVEFLDSLLLYLYEYPKRISDYRARRIARAPCPDLFYAYVGTGQVASLQKSIEIGYASTFRKARVANDKKDISELERIGTPPYDSAEKVFTYFKWLGHYEGEADRIAESSLLGRTMFGAPNFSLRDIYDRNRGFVQIPTWRLCQQMLNTDLASLGTDFRIPIFFFQGTDDEVTAASLAKGYFEEISAPHKEYVAFNGVGHFAVWNVPDKFRQELAARVRPLAIEP